jgi:cytoskeletal protein CcmA (bactofilin family)
MGLFGRSDSKKTDMAGIETIVGATTTLNGSLRVDGGVRIDGRFEGTLEVGGNVVVGEQGRVIADINACHVTVGGAVRGNIHATGRLEILATGQVLGDIQASQIVIDQGGLFQGQSRMSALDQPALAAPSDPAPEGPLDLDFELDPLPGEEEPMAAHANIDRSGDRQAVEMDAVASEAAARNDDVDEADLADGTIEAKARPAQRRPGGLGRGLDLDEVEIEAIIPDMVATKRESSGSGSDRPTSLRKPQRKGKRGGR